MAEESLGLGLGSNEGNRIENLRLAVESVQLFCPNGSVLTSSVFETQPVNCPEGSEAFYNAVIEVKCDLDPEELLERCQSIEKKLGRVSGQEANAPRPIDIDILFFGDLRVSGSSLEVPHPRLLQRRFVLEPLSEIRPGLILPGETSSIEEILAELNSDEPPLSKIYESGFWL